MRKLLVFCVLAGLMTTTTACTPFSSDSMRIVVSFRDSAGLYVGNDVGVLGVSVGTVKAIEPSGDEVRVTLDVGRDVKIPVDAGAVIVSRSVATDRYVELTPVYDSGPVMRTGAHIPVTRTKTPVDFEEVLRSINEFATGIAGSKDTSQAVRRFIRVGAKTFGKNGPTLNRAVTTLGTAVDSISGQRNDFVQTMASLDTLTSALAKNEHVLREFLSSAARSTAMLADERENMHAAMVTLSRAVDVVSTYARTNTAEFQGTLSEATALTNTLLSRKHQLESFVELMPLVGQNLARAIPGGQALVRAPISSVVGGSVLQQMCQKLAGPLCEIAGSDPTTPFAGILGPLLALLGPAK